MNRRSVLGMIAGMFGLGVCRGGEPEWPQEPIVPEGQPPWRLTGHMRIVEDNDGLTGTLQQEWACGEHMREWRDVPVVGE